MPRDPLLLSARRVLITGVTGSGKTWLARRLAQITGLPCHEADALAYDAGWTQVDREEQRRRVAPLLAADGWILDAAYSSWRDLALPRADLVVGLDYPRWVSFGRLLRRTTARVVTREPVCNGNVETLRQVCSRDSILLWHPRSFARKRAQIAAWAADPAGPPTLVLRSAAQTRRWLAAVEAARATGRPRVNDIDVIRPL